MRIFQNEMTVSLFLILTLAIQARKNHDIPDGYEDDGGEYDASSDSEDNDLGSGSGYATNGSDDHGDMGYTGSSENDGYQNGIKWISPSSGDILPSGQALTVTWSSPQPIYSPSFSLCTSTSSTSTAADCGNESWPNVKDNEDGTYSAIVIMPVISQSIEKLYLSMNNPTNKGRTFNSPVFGVEGDSGVPNAYVASPLNPTTAVIPTSMPTASSPSLTDAIGDELAGTGTASATIPVFTSPLTLSSTVAIPISGSTVKVKPTVMKSIATSITPTIMATPTIYSNTPTIQAPLQATYSYPYSYTQPPQLSANANANPNANNMTANEQPSKPNIKAIALPISICGLILIAALIFCARSRVFRKTGLGKDVENDWQSVIKEKAAAASSLAVAPSGSKGGVEVRERKEVVADGIGVVPILGYRGRQYSREYENGRSLSREERFTQVPKVDYERRGSRNQRFMYDERDRGGGRDRRHKHRHRERREREIERERDESYYTYPSDRSRRSSARDDYDNFSGRSRGYYSTNRRSSGGIGGIYDREYPYEQSSSSYGKSSCGRPSIAPRESYCAPLSNPYDPPTPTKRTSRPLPEPIIRSSTNSFARSNMYDHHLQEEVMMPRQKTLPHLSGGLRDDRDLPSNVGGGGGRERRGRGESGREREFESDTEAGWEMDLANQGRYFTGEEGMGELYESLRRAIQRG
ncbi:uncharacterized protein L199_002285 [Kwoniella botswanensis]|uniref:uncharacterized protein n=1 Tax=Kwoniella botswanensis TaxID=1268659 RepID=UPI00315C6659